MRTSPNLPHSCELADSPQVDPRAGGSERYTDNVDGTVKKFMADIATTVNPGWDNVMCAICCAPKDTDEPFVKVGPDKPIWIEEYATKKEFNLHCGAGICVYPSPDNTGGFSSAFTMAYASRTVHNTLALLNAAATQRSIGKCRTITRVGDGYLNIPETIVYRYGQVKPLLIVTVDV
jgi:hypothetical protein